MDTMQSGDTIDDLPLPFSYSPPPSSCKAQAGTPHTNSLDDFSEDEFDLGEYVSTKGKTSDVTNRGGGSVAGDGNRGASTMYVCVCACDPCK